MNFCLLLLFFDLVDDATSKVAGPTDTDVCGHRLVTLWLISIVMSHWTSPMCR